MKGHAHSTIKVEVENDAGATIAEVEVEGVCDVSLASDVDVAFAISRLNARVLRAVTEKLLEVGHVEKGSLEEAKARVRMQADIILGPRPEDAADRRN